MKKSWIAEYHGLKLVVIPSGKSAEGFDAVVYDHNGTAHRTPQSESLVNAKFNACVLAGLIFGVSAEQVANAVSDKWTLADSASQDS